MPFLDDFDLVLLKRKFEERDHAGLHKLRCYGSAPEAGEFLLGKT